MNGEDPTQDTTSVTEATNAAAVASHRRLFYASSATLALLGFVFTFQAVVLGIGTLSLPGAGLWPLFFGIVLVVLSVVLFLNADRKSVV